MNFKERLKEIRTEQKRSQTETAKAIGVTQGMISQWEKGLCEPTATNICKLADYFGVCTDYLLGRQDWY